MSNSPRPTRKLTLAQLLKEQESPAEGKSLDLQQIQRLLSNNSDEKDIEQFWKEITKEKEIKPVRAPSPGVSVFSNELKAKSKRPAPLRASSSGEGSERKPKDKSSISRSVKKKVVNLWRK